MSIHRESLLGKLHAHFNFPFLFKSKKTQSLRGQVVAPIVGLQHFEFMLRCPMGWAPPDLGTWGGAVPSPAVDGRLN